MSFVTEIKRRGVLQVGAAYTVVAWLLVQVASIILPTFEAPLWGMQAIVLLLLIGFPIAIALAWIYDLTSEGLRRTEDTEAVGDAAAFPGHVLNYVIIGLLAAAVLLFALDKFYWQTNLETSAEGRKLSIAVLPFRNMSGDPLNDPFAVGIHDDLLTQISKISALRTMSRTTMLRYHDTEKSIPEIAGELGVNIILEGGVQRSDDRVRINAQLIDGATDAHLWAETYDRQLTAANIFLIQSEIALAIARALEATLTPDEKLALEQVPTEDLEAYDAYVLARSKLNNLGNEDMATAVEQFTLATDLDPDFAAAWAGLCEAQMAFYRRSSDQKYFDSAKAACDRALELDNARIEVHIALARLYRHYGQYSRAEVALQNANFARAEAALENALENDSFAVEALIELGLLHANQNRLAQAEAELLRAAELDPNHWSAQTSLFSFYYRHSDRPDHFERAAHHASLSASLRPDIAASWNNLGSANFMLAQYEEAVDAWQRSLAIEPTRAAYTNTGLALYYTGKFVESAEMQLKATEIAPNDHRAWGRLADAQRFVAGQEDDAEGYYVLAAELARQQLEVNDRDWHTLGLMSVYLANTDLPAEAADTADRALELANRNAESLFYAALARLASGDPGACLDLLEEAVAKDDSYRHLIEIEPALGSIAGQERFRALIAAPG